MDSGLNNTMQQVREPLYRCMNVLSYALHQSSEAFEEEVIGSENGESMEVDSCSTCTAGSTIPLATNEIARILLELQYEDSNLATPPDSGDKMVAWMLLGLRDEMRGLGAAQTLIEMSHGSMKEGFVRYRCHGKDTSFKAAVGSAAYDIILEMHARSAWNGPGQSIHDDDGETACRVCKLDRKTRGSKHPGVSACETEAKGSGIDDPKAKRRGTAAYDSGRHSSAGLGPNPDGRIRPARRPAPRRRQPRRPRMRDSPNTPLQAPAGETPAVPARRLADDDMPDADPAMGQRRSARVRTLTVKARENYIL